MIESPYRLAVASLVLSCGWQCACADPPLKQAHAHNDYLHNRPLHDALAQRFCSVEADVFLVNGELLVAHTPFELDSTRTLRNLYLDPLHKRVIAHGGSVYAEKETFTLLVDIKHEGEQVWRTLNTLLAHYPDVFSRVEDGKLHRKAVTVIVSGDRAVSAIEKSNPRFAGVDGRISDLKSDRSASLMPLISDNWKKHFKWNGEGVMPPDEVQRLHSFVSTAHAQGRLTRFWGSPDRPEIWNAQYEAGVDLINTDNLKGLRKFLQDRNAHSNDGDSRPCNEGGLQPSIDE